MGELFAYPQFLGKSDRDVRLPGQGCPGYKTASKTSGHSQDVLADVGEDEVGGDGDDLVEAAFAEFAPHIALFGEAEDAVGLQGDVGRFPDDSIV